MLDGAGSMASVNPSNMPACQELGMLLECYLRNCCERGGSGICPFQTINFLEMLKDGANECLIKENMDDLFIYCLFFDQSQDWDLQE